MDVEFENVGLAQHRLAVSLCSPVIVHPPDPGAVVRPRTEIAVSVPAAARTYVSGSSGPPSTILAARCSRSRVIASTYACVTTNWVASSRVKNSPYATELPGLPALCTLPSVSEHSCDTGDASVPGDWGAEPSGDSPVPGLSADSAPPAATPMRGRTVRFFFPAQNDE